MAYREIWHEIIIKASPDEVYQALTDVKKLAHWWTTETRGICRREKIGILVHGKFLKEMVVTTLKVDELVRWRATERSDPDWVNTEIEWKIFREADKTFLHLRHSKWREDAKCSLSPRCTGCFSCLASRNLSRRARAVRILTTYRWAYKLKVLRERTSLRSPCRIRFSAVTAFCTLGYRSDDIAFRRSYRFTETPFGLL